MTINLITRNCMDEERLTLLLDLTSIRSDKKIRTLKLVCVDGLSFEDACFMTSLDKGDFNKCRKALNEVAHIVEQIKEKDLRQ